ncbi:TPA: hypothetical protein ACHWY2_003104 [Legionella pneumophila]|uniref:hypothetical protein n=2 Tax=Legionella pneumophila TaxID=446 RepID=UPI0013751FB4|nr:hypothetical protein [Legionella pneumophila]MDW9180817.1 hypothetical protein [Legionella pneumophila]HAT1700294.1 hypothetical protein [Legionella pneumophila]HAT1988302.1 hypothetical protein [Legionella pneumophila]HAT1989236.1 hypothetical protein [Legionella pneumophila]HAT2002593.1 hypothetical protein [Legionella pneumophila]
MNKMRDIVVIKIIVQCARINWLKTTNKLIVFSNGNKVDEFLYVANPCYGGDTQKRANK